MLKILSIHIPKTAGTSFYQNLQQCFGSDNCHELKRIDMNRSDIQTHLDNLAKTYRVLHGHFYFSEVRPLIAQYQPKIVCWYRHPIERLISDYRFFVKRLNDDKKTLKLHHFENMHRKNETLYTYASLAENQNVMSRYLAESDWPTFFFMGDMADYKNELQNLSEQIGKKLDTEIRLNTSGAAQIEYGTLSNWLKEKLEEWNADDLKLFAEIHAFRKKQTAQ